jgi:hypothetical protein
MANGSVWVNVLLTAGAEWMALDEIEPSSVKKPALRGASPASPSAAEAAYLKLGLDQPGRKLPLFDAKGQPIRPQVIRTCLARGWAERWFANPMAPDWLVCRLTEEGRRALGRS